MLQWCRESTTFLNERFVVMIGMGSDSAGNLQMNLEPLEPGASLHLDQTSVAAFVWAEGDGTWRARLEHVASGTTSYIQGSASLAEFGKKLGLIVSRTPRTA